MSESEPAPPELLGFFEAERAVPRIEARARVALRERLAESFAHEPPLEEPRLATKPRGELARATAQEPVVAPPVGGRRKGQMNLFDKRIIGAATLTTAAIGLLAITVYRRQADAPAPQRQTSWDRDPAIAPVPSSPMTPRFFPPVAPTTTADLAMTATESAWIHVPIGTVDIEIQSNCDAEVELSPVAQVLMIRGQRADPAALETKTFKKVVAGTRSVDGRATTFHLTPGDDLPTSMYAYTSRCAGQPPVRGNIVLDRLDATEPIGLWSNARIYHNTKIDEGGVHVFGTVLPGARVSIGAKRLALGPADPVGGDLPIYSSFAADVPHSVARPQSRDTTPIEAVAAVRVDDTNGTHFYLVRPSGSGRRK